MFDIAKLRKKSEKCKEKPNYIATKNPQTSKKTAQTSIKKGRKNDDHRKATKQPTPRRGKQRDHQSTQGASQKQKRRSRTLNTKKGATPTTTMKNTIFFGSFFDVKERTSYLSFKGGGWACAFRRMVLAVASLRGHGLAVLAAIADNGKRGGGYSPHPSARSTATRVTLKQAGGYSRQPPTTTPRRPTNPTQIARRESLL